MYVYIYREKNLLFLSFIMDTLWKQAVVDFVYETLRVDIESRCIGCQTNHLSQKHHLTCLEPLDLVVALFGMCVQDADYDVIFKNFVILAEENEDEALAYLLANKPVIGDLEEVFTAVYTKFGGKNADCAWKKMRG